MLEALLVQTMRLCNSSFNHMMIIINYNILLKTMISVVYSRAYKHCKITLINKIYIICDIPYFGKFSIWKYFRTTTIVRNLNV